MARYQVPARLHRFRQSAVLWSAALVALGTWTVASRPASAAEAAAPTCAVRLGWAYGLGGEVEVRPKHWGFGASGGYVPGYGAGGYAGGQWGSALLGGSGAVAEAGLYRGVVSPLRSAPAGFGAYALAGGEVALGSALLRGVAGGGVPFTARLAGQNLEFLAKVTVGIAF